MSKKCKECEKNLTGKQQKWCSHTCQTQFWARNNGGKFHFICEGCKKDFYHNRRLNAKGQAYRFCSLRCVHKYCGELRIKQKTRHKTSGYVSIWKPEHPKAYGGRVREHILVMEKILGRYLTKNEIVHHINYLEDDNREKNLYLCKSYKRHNKVHKLSRFLIKEFIRKEGLNEKLTDFIISNCGLFNK